VRRPSSSDGLGRKLLQDALLPLRRTLSRAALVYEERHFRDIAVNDVYNELEAEATKLQADLKSLEERVIIRVDTLMEELWRRMEGVGARQATEIQRLAAQVEDLRARTEAQLAEIQRLALRPAESPAGPAEPEAGS